MKGYKTILVAVELNQKTDEEPLKHAEFFAKEFGAKVFLVHAVEHIGSYGAYGIGVGFEIEQALLDNANKEMKRLGKKVGIPEDRCAVSVGPAKFTILEDADKIGADLIIVGSHGRNGIRALLGSTANAVLHGATRDVLAVRLKE